MKRTRQVFHYEQDQVPVDISGCRMFHGEDLRKYTYPRHLLSKSSSFERIRGGAEFQLLELFFKYPRHNC
jgi:hypothetical protein